MKQIKHIYTSVLSVYNYIYIIYIYNCSNKNLMFHILSIGLAKVFIQVTIRCYRKTQMSFLARTIITGPNNNWKNPNKLFGQNIKKPEWPIKGIILYVFLKIWIRILFAYFLCSNYYFIQSFIYMYYFFFLVIKHRQPVGIILKWPNSFNPLVSVILVNSN